MLWEFGLANALTVAVLAPAAYLAARLAKRPAWAHAVWLIVLLKLVTPPFVGVPVPAITAAAEEPGEAAPPRSMSLEPVESPAVALAAIEVEPAPSALKIEPREEAPALAPPVARQAEPPMPVAPIPPRWSWGQILAGLWVVGSVGWLSLALIRIGRFARAVRLAGEAPPELVARVERLSEQLALRTPPLVVLVKGRVSPMVWTLGGRSRLIVPEPLWDRLDDDQRSALLVHELAHLKRGDPWVRLLELVATGLYWWHPALWLARKELHRAEEACCDLWVVWALPESRKRYASALVEAVDYLSESRPQPLPLGASGMGQVEDLTRRIGMIMQGDTPRGLNRAGALAAIGLALVLLPWRPTRAEQEPAKLEDTRPAIEQGTQARDLKTLPAESKDETIPNLEDADPSIRKAFQKHQGASRLGKEIERLKGEIEAATAKLPPDSVDIDPGLAKMREDLSGRQALYDEIWRQVDLMLKDRSPESGGLSGVSGALRLDLEKAQAQLDWAEQARAKGLVPSTQVIDARAQVERVKLRIDEERKARAEAPRKAAQEAKLLQTQVALKKALLAKAVAQRQIAVAEVAKLESLSKRAVGFVSTSEMAKANGDLAIAEAQVDEAKAGVAEAEILLENAVENGQGPGQGGRRGSGTAVADEPILMPQGSPRDPNQRIDELEAKLDKILKELETLRKEKSPGVDVNVPRLPRR